jgi:hypothetical protein
MDKDKRDKEFNIPIQYSMQCLPQQVEFPTEITTRESSLHLTPGAVRFVGKRELEHLNKILFGFFRVMVVTKVKKKVDDKQIVPQTEEKEKPEDKSFKTKNKSK